MGAALQIEILLSGGRRHEPDERRMGDGPVQRAASVKAVKAHCRPAAELHVAPRRHVRRVGCKDDVELNGNLGLERLRCGDGASEVELLLDGKYQMNGWPAADGLEHACRL